MPNRRDAPSTLAALPLCLPGEDATAGFHHSRNARAVVAGLSFCPEGNTARDLRRHEASAGRPASA